MQMQHKMQVELSGSRIPSPRQEAMNSVLHYKGHRDLWGSQGTRLRDTAGADEPQSFMTLDSEGIKAQGFLYSRFLLRGTISEVVI